MLPALRINFALLVRGQRQSRVRVTEPWVWSTIRGLPYIVSFFFLSQITSTVTLILRHLGSERLLLVLGHSASM